MDRQRLTITIKKNLIKKVDKTVDGTRIRNRSHAIEYLLSKSLKPPISQAIILAGGEGVKMRPLTYEIPKPLIPVGGKPIMEYLIEGLREAKIRDIILAVGHLSEKIKDYFGNGLKYGVKITYSEESKNLGTAGAVANCRRLLLKNPFIVLHGDILVDLDISEFIQFYEGQNSATASIVLSTSSNPTEYGNVRLKGIKILKFIEKPSKKQSASHLISTGVYIFRPEIFNYIPEKMPCMLENIFPQLAKEKKLNGFIFGGKWFDVSTPKNYAKAISQWKNQ